MAILDQKRLHALLEYDPDTGSLAWKARPRNDFALERDWKSWNTRFYGKPAGWLDGAGYARLNIDGKTPRAHQVAWAYVHGSMPADTQIDHINGKRDDNRIENLRIATQADNCRNMKLSKKNKSGAPGVYVRKGKWWARITYNWRIIHLGQFDTLEDAVTARKEAEKQYGFHENHGRNHGGEAKNSKAG